MEKINHIEINNFKSIKHLKIDGFKKINVFIGMPNAGKSNILEALGLFGAIDYHNFNIDTVIRYNNIKEIFFEENITKYITVTINKSVLTLSVEEHDPNQIEPTFVPKFHKFHDDYKFSFGPSNAFESNLKYSVKKYHFKILERERSVKTGIYRSLMFPFGENLSDLLAIDSNLRKIVLDFFKKNNLKILLDKGSNDLKVFREYQDGTVFTLPYNLIADTLQRLVFYKLSILSNKDTVLLFEEPEAHCFEPYILEFTNSVKYDKNDNQFFIVTHSDFIIQEFLRDEESRGNTNIYLVNNVDGETKVKVLAKEKNEDVYELGMNPFFNFENLWETN